MNHIHEPTDAFSFDALKLSKPITLPGGSYFIRFTVNNAPLYIQPPKCKTKQGFLKTGRRYYTDLIFTNTDDEFIRWMENLETTCHNHLFANRDKWFEGDMELSDIENYFSSPMKIYKTGKYYIVRVNVQTNLGVPSLTIYDEANNVIPIDAIDDKSDIITILEIKGIKCTTTSFQIEIETKQVLMIKPVELFTRCVIKTQPHSVPHVKSPEFKHTANDVNRNNNDDAASRDDIDDAVMDDDVIDNDNHNNETVNAEETKNMTILDAKAVETTQPNLAELGESSPSLVENIPLTTHDNTDTMNKNITLNGADPITESVVTNPESVLIVNTDNFSNEPDLELTEFNIDLDTLPAEDNITIKKSNDVYYEMYREACRKAKIARDLALSSYLEAKRIKNTYMLDDITDSDESDLEQESNIE